MKEYCGDFIISATNQSEYDTRSGIIKEVTGFWDGYFDTSEKDDECDLYRIKVWADFERIEDLKEVIDKMKIYDWFLINESSINDEDIELFTEGKWLTAINDKL